MALAVAWHREKCKRDRWAHAAQALAARLSVYLTLAKDPACAAMRCTLPQLRDLASTSSAAAVSPERAHAWRQHRISLFFLPSHWSNICLQTKGLGAWHAVILQDAPLAVFRALPF